MAFRAVLVLAALLAGACRDGAGGDDDIRTTGPTAASTTTTTAVSYDVPTTIDAAYIEKVMAALDHVEGEAVRYLARARRVDEEFLRYLVSIYHPEALDLTQQAWLEVAGSDFAMLASQPEDPTTTVERVLLASETCVMFAAKRDYSGLFVQPDPPRPQRYIALVPLLPARKLAARNPTPWAMSFDGRFKDGGEPTKDEVCAS